MLRGSEFQLTYQANTWYDFTYIGQAICYHGTDARLPPCEVYLPSRRWDIDRIRLVAGVDFVGDDSAAPKMSPRLNCIAHSRARRFSFWKDILRKRMHAKVNLTLPESG